MKNKTKYIIQYAINSVAMLLVTNSIIQAFLIECGISEERVAIYSGVIQIVNAAVTFLLTFFIDRIKNIIKIYSVLSLSQLIIIATLVFFCLSVGQQIPNDVKFWSVIIAGTVTNMLHGIYGVLSYKVPYHIMNIAEYGDVTGKAGIVVGAVGAITTSSLSFFQSKFNYFVVMLAFFTIAAVAFIVSYFLIRSYKITPEASIATSNESVGKHINILTYKPFYILLGPNLLRAYSEGVALAAMTVGSFLHITNKSSGADMTTISQIATILGCFIFTLAIRKISVGRVILISSIGLAVCMPAMYLFGTIVPFYIAYGFTYLFVIIIQYAYPFAVTKIVDYEVVGQYTTFRMLIHTLGLAIANFTVIPLVNIFGGTLTMLLAVAGQVVSGLVYYIYLKKLNK